MNCKKQNAKLEAQLEDKTELCEQYSAVINALPKHQLSVMCDALVAAFHGVRGEALEALVTENVQSTKGGIHGMIANRGKIRGLVRVGFEEAAKHWSWVIKEVR